MRIASLIFASFCVLMANSQKEGRIIGGANAPAGLFPFMAAIQVHTNTSRYFCGGSLINNQWILTSAHCAFDAQTFVIQLGSNTLTSPDSNRVTVSTSEYVVHPEFDPYHIRNDIALIKLRIPITFTTYIQPISLSSVPVLDESFVTVAGWGQTSDDDDELSEALQFVGAVVLSNAECRLIYGNQITDRMACVEGQYNEGTCVGDNGGPLLEHFQRRFWLVGVASFISGNGCETVEPSGFTRSYPYISWINGVIAEN